MSGATIAETRLAFPCFGGRAEVIAMGEGDVDALVNEVRARLERWHHAFTRFDPASELSLLNASPSERVRVSAMMCQFVAAAVNAAHRTGGLVDPTLVPEMESAGYRSDLGMPVPLETSLILAPPRRAASARPDARWREVRVDSRRRIVSRPPGVRLDSGGIAKGLFADMAGAALAGCASFVVDCCGDLRLGGRDRLERSVQVESPFGGHDPLHTFQIDAGAVATSGIGRRSWIGDDGLPAHHLLDPSTGRPAYTGVVQATALSRTAADAEVRAKGALLAGPERGHDWLRRYGGVLVFDDGSHAVVEAG
jgi:thiamine biosynthesis lipoprotein